MELETPFKTLVFEGKSCGKIDFKTGYLERLSVYGLDCEAHNLKKYTLKILLGEYAIKADRF